jgi:multidrug efflux pump subunit AcrA (membrane-fusion protein)
MTTSQTAHVENEIRKANSTIRAYHEASDTSARVQAETDALIRKCEDRFKAIISGDNLAVPGTLEEVKNLFTTAQAARERLDTARKSASSAKDDARTHRESAVKALVTEFGLLDINRPVAVTQTLDNIGRREDKQMSQGAGNDWDEAAR